jgi:HD-like signal output (HDOD) protein
MHHVLLVDDEAEVLQALRKSLRAFTPAWSVATASSGDAALEVLGREPIDAVVTDARMPGLSGPALLEEVQRRAPGALRFVLSGEPGALTANLPSLAHQVLLKPLRARLLHERVERSLALRDRLCSPALQTLVARLGPVPALPGTWLALAPLLDQPEATIDQVVGIVGSDPAIAAGVLRLVNSVWFSPGAPVTGLKEAVQRLGFNHLRDVVLTAGLFGDDAAGERLRHGALRRAGLVRALLAAARLPALVEASATAAVLADLGAWVLTTQAPDLAAEVERDVALGLPREEVELRVLGVEHALLGAALLGFWALPVELVEAVAGRAGPWSAEGPASVASALGLACLLEALDEAGPGARPGLERQAATLVRLFPPLDLPALEALRHGGRP